MTEQYRIRSYVLRQSRLSAAQKRALTDTLPQWGIPYQSIALNLSETFIRTAPCHLEIGYGNGGNLISMACANPQHNYLGLEVHSPGVGSVLQEINDHGLTNVRLIQYDATQVIEHMLAHESLSSIYIFFPDPWPKKRHKKRRLIQPEFANLLSAKLGSEGLLYLATDCEDYAHHMLSVLSKTPKLINTTIDFSPRATFRSLTRFEQRGLKLGHKIFDLCFKKAP